MITVTAPAERTSFILIRHGETGDNAARTPRGQGHGSLTARGRDQARALGERLSRWEFDPLYCSDLRRAVQTAAAISRFTGHELRQTACLRERHFGLFEGVPWAEIEQRYPREFGRYRARDPDYALPGGESPRQLHERSVHCLESIARRHAGESIVVVTHGGVIHSFLRAVLGIPLTAPRQFKVANASLSLFVGEDQTWQLVTFGDVCHLEAKVLSG